MTEEDSIGTTITSVPEAVVQRKRLISMVWLVPIIAALIGSWLAIKALSQMGPTITIYFDDAEGLVAGKTRIMYKNVELGKVDAIRLSEDLSRVEVTAKLSKETENFLSTSTRFWVVRARVAAGEVSGLETLFSGAYIGMDPGKGGEYARSFTGLKTPPIVTTDLPGRRFVLRAEKLGSLDVGSPVYFRQIRVGQVDAYQLTPDGQAVNITIFIEAPHHEKVHTNTRFWNAGGVDVTVTSQGVKMDSDSLITVLFGGIAFETPPIVGKPIIAEEMTEFDLYKNRSAAFEFTSGRKQRYLMYFDETVRGLSVGSLVEFRGIKIGQVVDIQLIFDVDTLSFKIAVLVEIVLDRILVTPEPMEEERQVIDQLVTKGLRAQLKMGNFVTGQLIVDLDFHKGAPPAGINYTSQYPELPTIPAPLSKITNSLSLIFEKLERLPIEEIGNSLQNTVSGAERLVNSDELKNTMGSVNETLRQIKTLIEGLDSKTAFKIGETLDEAQKLIQSAEAVLKNGSPLQQEMQEMLKEVSQAARSIRNAAETLERHPDAFIYGKDENK
jgi:paraquat-inducible protein B